MNFNWLSYLEVAEILLDEVRNNWDQETDLSLKEAKIRSSISRAYYSAFCLVRNYLRDIEGYTELNESKPLKGGVHRYVIDEILLISKNRDFRVLGEDLRSLRNLRNNADYEDEIIVYSLNTKITFHSINTKTQAEKALNYAKKIIKLLNKLQSS